MRWYRGVGVTARRECCHVLVVGAGGAGLAAAIEAAEAGAAVILLEKNSVPGGSTSWSIGSVTSTRTIYQRRKGIEDDPLHHWEDMRGFSAGLDSRDNPQLRRILCDEIPHTFQWLLDSGVRFYGPMPEPPHRQPRMHNVLPNSRAFIYHLERRARRAGVDIRTGAEVVQLIRADSGIVGVTYRTDQNVREIRAPAVILAAGDFTNSPELKSRFMGPGAAQVEAVNQMATGDGQRLAELVGGRIVNGDLALGPELRFVAPQTESLVRRLPPLRSIAKMLEWSLGHLPGALLRPFMMKFLTTALAPAAQLFADGAVLLNARGERLCDEGGKLAHALAQQTGKMGYILLDARLARLYEAWPNFISTAPGIAYAYLGDYRRNRPDIYLRCKTLEQLAGQLRMDVAALRASADGRLGEGPFVTLGPVRPVFVHSEGGLAVDESHRVLADGNRAIPGLYAAGSTGQGGLLLKGHGHHLAWAFVSGRRAGRIAAQKVLSGNKGRACSP